MNCYVKIFLVVLPELHCHRIFTFLDQVGSDSYQGAGAPTMFQAMRRIVGSLANSYAGESAFDRAIRRSFLGMHQLEAFNCRLHSL